jgi:hypothetical protein
MKGISSGYEGLNTEENYTIPKNGIENVDRAVFDLFDTKISFEVKNRDETIKVPVVFASGERFALTRRKEALRDDNNALILPIISIVRKNVDMSPGQSGYGTPISYRDQDLYIIKRRLSDTDRDYQNIINKIGLKNQENVSRRKFVNADVYPGNIQVENSQASRRNGKNLSYYKDKIDLSDRIGKNIFEIITIPYPEFFTIEYDITFWTQYVTESNQMIEHLMAKFHGQDRGFQIFTREGYEHFAYISSAISSGDNFTEYSSEERIIKHSFTITVPSYLLAPEIDGVNTPFRRFLSSPEINFEISEAKSSSIKTESKNNNQDKTNKFILSDVEQLDKDGNVDEGIEDTGIELLFEDIDPKTGQITKEYRKVLSRNKRKGETVLSSDFLRKIEDIK